MLWVALLLGLVEGLTEFLPVSSTGHLILTTSLVERLLEQPIAAKELFIVSIQFGAILAVVWEYRAKLVGVALDLPRSPAARAFVGKIALAFCPSAIVGVLVHDFMKERLWAPLPVAFALFVGGALILIVERWHRGEASSPVAGGVDSIAWAQSLKIGLAQCLSLWPGFSRSAATILGGLGVGLDRRTATEFSFFLAIPTMFGAAVYEVASTWSALAPGDLLWFALAFVVSFFVAWASVKWLLHYVSHHTFAPFAWYRMALGGAILLLGF